MRSSYSDKTPMVTPPRSPDKCLLFPITSAHKSISPTHWLVRLGWDYCYHLQQVPLSVHMVRAALPTLLAAFFFITSPNSTALNAAMLPLHQHQVLPGPTLGSSFTTSRQSAMLHTHTGLLLHHFLPISNAASVQWRPCSPWSTKLNIN